MRDGLPSACSLLFCLGLGVALSSETSPAHAQASSSKASAALSAPTASAFSSSAHRGASRHVGAPAEHRQVWSVDDEPYIGRGAPQWRYFVEFRARSADSYGHMYVMFGQVNDRHEITKSESAGSFRLATTATA